MSRLYKPLIALILAIVPFFLFLGVTDTVTVNGEVVSDNRFNLGGLVMVVIALGIVWSVLRPSAPRGIARQGVAMVAGLFCALQIASSIDVIRIDPLDWAIPDRHLPTLQYTALADNDRIYLSVESPEAFRRALATQKGDVVGKARIHQSYADRCHGGRYRADLARAAVIPDYFSDEERDRVEQRARGLTQTTPMECTLSRSNRLMGEEVDSLNRAMDLFDRLEEEYHAAVDG